MRAGLPNLPSPYPLINYLPEVYADDQWMVRWTAALDEVLATMVNTIDCLGAYIDPLLAPEDFMGWLAGWVAVVLDESWSVQAQRAVIAEAVDLYRMRGTMTGLRRHLEAVVDGRVEITESGGVSPSQRPRPQPPKDVEHWVHVRVWPNDPRTTSAEAVLAVIRAAKPVHVVHSLEVMTS
jgi:phage tail-like protein